MKVVARRLSWDECRASRRSVAASALLVLAIGTAAMCAFAADASAQQAIAAFVSPQIAVPRPVTSSHPTIDITQAAPSDTSFSLQSPGSSAVAGAPAAPGDTSVATSFDEFSRNVHGYASAGIGTHDGHEFQGGVLIPLIPGKLELEAGAGTSQQGGLPRIHPGSKPFTERGTSYYAALHAHPSDDVDVTLGFSHSDFTSGGSGGRYGSAPLFR